MKIKKYKNNKKIAILFAVLVVSLLLVTSYMYVKHLWIFSNEKQTNINMKKATKDQKKAGDDIKSESYSANSKTPDGDKQVSKTEKSTNVNVLITAANQNDSTLQIRSLIESVESEGICTLTLTKDSAVVTRDAGIQPLASTSTCRGFDIPTSDLSEGLWKINLVFKSSTASGQTTGSVEIK